MADSPVRESILVVDDTVENVRLLASMLAEHGYEIRPVTNARDALQAVNHAPPDLILLDINMPDMNGFETCQRLQELGFKDIPIIFLTALTDVADKVRAFDVGGVDYITKPFQIEEVLARVKAHLALRSARVELIQSYQRLSQLEKLRDDLVNMIVHDMRSPLTVLIFQLETVATESAQVLDQEATEGLQEAIAAAASIRRMANELLDVSRLESGQFPLDRKPVDLTEIVRQATAAMAGLDRDRVIEIEGPGPVACHCDAGVIRRVLENLVSNAIKHTPSPGRVSTAVMATGPNVRVEVRDQGRGVPPEARTRIFEKFGAMTARREGEFHSVGLGLAFCKLAVEAHGGTIGVTDGDPAGSVFWFELPRGSKLSQGVPDSS